MNTIKIQNALGEVKQAWNDVPEDDKREVGHLLGSAIAQTTLIVKAWRAHRKGDYSKANFYIMWWVGTCMNNRHALLELRRKAEHRKFDSITRDII